VGDVPDWKALLDRVRKAMANAEFVRVSPFRIRPMPGQPRDYFDENDLLELSDSITSVGQFQPGIIRAVADSSEHDYELLDGERRWRAIILGKVDVYKAMLVEIDDEAAPYVVASIANFNRAGHTHMEISNAIHRLHNGLKIPIEVIAKMYNITQYWAYQLEGLQKLHPQIRNLLDPKLKARDQLPITAAIQVAKLDQAVQAELVEKYKSKEVTLKGLRKEAIAIATRTGTYIRQREAGQPARRLASAEALTRSLLRTATDLKAMVGEEGMDAIIKSNPKTMGGILAVLKQADDQLVGVRYAINSHLR
jgi:ParB/RepB/Spo0J family partition protein